MKNKTVPAKFSGKNVEKETDNNFEGYPHYPPSEDIYSQFKEEINIDPENVLETKVPNADDTVATQHEHDFKSDPDVPNSESDDAQEAVGSEDEENNYYSIGGDNHNDLEENQDDLEENQDGLEENQDDLKENQSA